MRHGEGQKREPAEFNDTDSPIYQTWNPLYHTGGTYSQNCIMETPRCTKSDLLFGKFPDLVDFQCWRVNIKTEVCLSTPFPQLTMSWINGEEMERSIDDLVTSRSIEGRKDFPDFEMLDAKIVSALRKIIFNTSFKGGESVLKSSDLKNKINS